MGCTLRGVEEQVRGYPALSFPLISDPLHGAAPDPLDPGFSSAGWPDISHSLTLPPFISSNKPFLLACGLSRLCHWGAAVDIGE